MSQCDVAVIGAGPYGLSVAAHLNTIPGLDVMVFGRPMSFWSEQMPKGMLLRSPYQASFLSNPESSLTLDDYQAERRTEVSRPVPLEKFIDYGLWFKRKAVPNVDTRNITKVEHVSDKFKLTLEDGEVVSARRVVVATGIMPFAHRPEPFRSIPSELATHSSEHRDLERFKGKEVIVLGGGQSALESAALLNEVGAKVELVVRTPEVNWLGKNTWLRTWPLEYLLYAWSDVGTAGVSHLIARPNLYKLLPRGIQDDLSPYSIRAGGARWLMPRVDKVISTTLGSSITAAVPVGDKLEVTLTDGSKRRVDHVMLGTGFKVNIALYPFLAPELVNSISRVGGFPVLNPGFETNVPGLHFAGAPAAWSFGPLMRFVAGSAFAARFIRKGIVRKSLVRSTAPAKGKVIHSPASVLEK